MSNIETKLILFALCSLINILGMFLIDQHLLKPRMRKKLEAEQRRRIPEAEFEAFYTYNTRSRWVLNVVGALSLGWLEAIILSSQLAPWLVGRQAWIILGVAFGLPPRRFRLNSEDPRRVSAPVLMGEVDRRF